MSLNLLSAAYHFPEGIPLWPAKNLAGHRWTETIALESIDSLERIERISLVSKVVINDTAAETIGKRPWIIHEEQSGRMLRYFIQKISSQCGEHADFDHLFATMLFYFTIKRISAIYRMFH